MKKMRTKKSLIIFTLMAAFTLNVFLSTTNIYAQVDEEEVAKQEQTPIITQETKEKEVRYPNKLMPKEPTNELDKDKITNKGIPTTQSDAKATLIESVDNTNSPYPVHHEGDAEGEVNDKYSADARQFISFKTKNGKVFHLIINHDEEGQNVMLLTEVSEDDLLNITGADKPKEVVKAEPIEEPKKEKVKEEPKKESSSGIYLFVGLIVLCVVSAGYYFKVYKKKQDETEEEEEVYDETEDDYEVEETPKSDEEMDMDEMAIENFDEDEE